MFALLSSCLVKCTSIVIIVFVIAVDITNLIWLCLIIVAASIFTKSQLASTHHLHLLHHSLRKINVATVENTFFGCQRRSLQVRLTSTSWITDVLKRDVVSQTTTLYLLLHELLILHHLKHCFSIILYVFLFLMHLMQNILLCFFSSKFHHFLLSLVRNRSQVKLVQHVLIDFTESILEGLLSLIINMLLELILDLGSSLKKLNSLVAHLSRRLFHH